MAKANYYDRKKEYFNQLEQILKQSGEITFQILHYNLSNIYGFGGKVLKERLLLLKEIGKIELNNEIIKWNN
jgi:hypothetical protein